MSGSKSRRKGAKEENSIKRLLQAKGFAAEKISRMYRPGEDLTLSLLGADRAIEVKVRGTGFAQLYKWLQSRDILIVRSDRKQALAIVPLRFAIEVAAKAEGLTQSPPSGGDTPTV